MRVVKAPLKIAALFHLPASAPSSVNQINIQPPLKCLFSTKQFAPETAFISQQAFQVLQHKDFTGHPNGLKQLTTMRLLTGSALATNCLIGDW